MCVFVKQQESVLKTNAIAYNIKIKLLQMTTKCLQIFVFFYAKIISLTRKMSISEAYLKGQPTS